MDASILDHNFTVVAYIAKAIMDDTISDKIRELQVSALRKLTGQLNYYEERGFSEMLLCAIAEKKGKLILETTTKLEMDRVVSPRAPHFNGNRFTSDKYSIPEEELIAWSETSLKGPLPPEAFNRCRELFNAIFPEESKTIFGIQGGDQ